MRKRNKVKGLARRHGRRNQDGVAVGQQHVAQLGAGAGPGEQRGSQPAAHSYYRVGGRGRAVDGRADFLGGLLL